jgi:hypothetical protein
MDKREFIRLAPAYYHAAILIALKRRIPGAHFTFSDLKSALVIGNEEETFLSSEELINISLGKLLANGAISKITDPFGEALYRKTDKYDQAVEEDENDPSGPYRRNAVANDP